MGCYSPATHGNGLIVAQCWLALALNQPLANVSWEGLINVWGPGCVVLSAVCFIVCECCTGSCVPGVWLLLVAHVDALSSGTDEVHVIE